MATFRYQEFDACAVQALTFVLEKGTLIVRW